MLHGSRLRLDPAAGRHRRLIDFAFNFDITGRMDAMSSPEKTVAIIGGGPVGLAAAAHALEPRPQAGRARGGRQGGPCRAAMVARAHVLALVLQRRQGSGGVVARGRAGTARSRSGIRRAASSSRTISSRSPRARGSSAAHPDQRTRRFGWARRLRQGQDGGPRKRAL